MMLAPVWLLAGGAAIVCAFANRIRGGMLHLPGDIWGRLIWGVAFGCVAAACAVPWPWALAIGAASWLACSVGLGGGESMGLGKTGLMHDVLAMALFTVVRLLPAAAVLAFLHDPAWWLAPMIPLGPFAYYSGRWWPVAVPWLEFKAYDGADSAVGEFVWGAFAGALLVAAIYG